MTPATTTGTQFTVNGTRVEVASEGGRRLLDVLRVDLGLTGTKEGCGEGECGACTVLLDGEPVASCLVPVCQVDGHAVRTVEGLVDDGRMDPLQATFLEAGAAQCGICTPGMLMAARAYLDAGREPTDEGIREAIAGNLCRCTGYTKIVEAIRAAAMDAPVAPRPSPAGLPVPPAHAVSTAGGPQAASPRSLDEAFRLLAAGPWQPVAGGTDVMVVLAAASQDGHAPELPLLDLWRLDELRGVRVEGGSLVVGALTTYAELRASPLVAEHVPVLAEAAATIGAAQIQSRGTIGGNVVNASPAGDTLPVLLAADASLVLGSVRGERTVRAADFWTGYRATLRQPDELLLRIAIPLVPGRTIRYRKVGTRRAQAISKVVMALAWRAGEDGAWHDVRVALGSVAPVPIRARRAEAAIEGRRPTPETASAAAAAITGEITPIDDVRSTAEYRRAVTGRILHRALRDAGGW